MTLTEVTQAQTFPVWVYDGSHLVAEVRMTLDEYLSHPSHETHLMLLDPLD